jgi:hypothetical protein
VLAARDLLEREVVVRLVAGVPRAVVQLALELELPPGGVVVAAPGLEAQGVRLDQVGRAEVNDREQLRLGRRDVEDLPLVLRRRQILDALAVDVAELVHRVDLEHVLRVVGQRPGDVR